MQLLKQNSNRITAIASFSINYLPYLVFFIDGTREEYIC